MGIDQIYNIKTITSSKVQTEPLQKNKIIPQCKCCQEHGHTHNFCHKTSKHVKCRKQHFTRDCSKPSHAKPKCVHCGKNHPANYHGCKVYKDPLKLRNNPRKTQSESQTGKERKNKRTTCSQPNKLPQQPANMNKSTTSKPIKQTYRQTLMGKQQSSIETMLQQIMQRLDKLEADITNA
jgi:hypothetical protein